MVDLVLLRTYMRKAHVTQKQLAKRLGISEWTMSRRMHAREFSTGEAEKIAALLLIKDPARVFLSS